MLFFLAYVRLGRGRLSADGARRRRCSHTNAACLVGAHTRARNPFVGRGANQHRKNQGERNNQIDRRTCINRLTDRTDSIRLLMLFAGQSSVACLLAPRTHAHTDANVTVREKSLTSGTRPRAFAGVADFEDTRLTRSSHGRRRDRTSTPAVILLKHAPCSVRPSRHTRQRLRARSYTAHILP